MLLYARRIALVALAACGFTFTAQACTAEHPPSADPNASILGLLDGRCTVDGTTSACHVETGRVDGIVNCFAGKQTCMNGVWGPCVAGSEGTISSLSAKQMSSSLHLMGLTESAPAPDAGSCLQNPCNPYCNGIEVDADSMKPDGGFSQTVILGTVKTPDTFPGGITGPKNAMATYGATTPLALVACTQGAPPANGKICSSDFCCADYAVGGAQYTCQPWVNVGGTNPVADTKCVKNTGVDFTLGLACNDANGQVHVPVCNRGTANATSGNVMVAEYPGNPEYAGDLSGSGPGNFCNNAGSPSAYCYVNLASRTIPAGKCIDVNVSAGTIGGSAVGVTCPSPNFSSGNRTMMVNPVAPPTISWAQSFTPTYATVTEADYCNNYSFHPTTSQGGTCSAYGEQPPPPASTSYTYTASCQPGFRARWNQLSYSTQVPADSQITFSVASAPLLGDGGTGTFTADVQAANIKSGTSSPDPAICAMSGSPDANACPKNLATLLGPTASLNPVLKVSVTETAISSIPVVNGWQVTFNCVPYE